MKLRLFGACRIVIAALPLSLIGLSVAPSAAAPPQKFVIQKVAEKTLHQLPAGPLYWRIENLPTLAAARAAEGKASLAAQVAGKVWLFTLDHKNGATAGATEVVEIGPVPPISAPEYLLRINSVSGPPGATTPVHSHPGSETFYVLAGQLSQRTPGGAKHIDPGQSMSGHAPGTPMEVASSGTSDLRALVMFVVDATKPFSSPATLP